MEKKLPIDYSKNTLQDFQIEIVLSIIRFIGGKKSRFDKSKNRNVDKLNKCK